MLVRFDIPPEDDEHKVELPTRNEAILILQRNERARQSRQRATFMKQLRYHLTHYSFPPTRQLNFVLQRARGACPRWGCPGAHRENAAHGYRDGCASYPENVNSYSRKCAPNSILLLSFRGYKTRLASIRADKQELIFLRTCTAQKIMLVDLFDLLRIGRDGR